MKKCSKCKELHNKSGKYCNKCHAAYMRTWRKTHPMTEEQKRKDAARSYVGVYQKRGKIAAKPCRVCGAKAEKHHPDYSKPLRIVWLCRKHHLELHRRIVKRETLVNSRQAAL